MANDVDTRSPETEGQLRLVGDLPRPSLRYRVLAWHAFQRALDPLAPPRPLRQPRA
jgi:hypothetical protein